MLMRQPAFPLSQVHNIVILSEMAAIVKLKILSLQTTMFLK